jgi:predicted Zn-dependent peptidase
MLRHTVTEVSLSSGLKGLIVDTPKTGVVVAEVSFRAGEFLLDEQTWETAHLMEHVLLGANSGFKKARDFQVALEKNGAYSNASTSVYDITYEIESAHFEWERVLSLLLDAISAPHFLQEEFDTELSNVREELMSRSNNHFRHINAYLRQQMGLASLTDQERVERLSGVTRDHLIRHYERTHTLPNARFIIAGHFKGQHQTVIELLEQRLKLARRGSRIPMPDEQPVRLHEPAVVRKPSIPNIYLYVDLYSKRPFSVKERASLQLLSTMLTETMYSRIFGTAREKGWVYGMGSGYSQLATSTSWWLGAQVSKTNSQPLIRLVRDELQRVYEGAIENEDFEAAKQHLLGKTMRSGQTASGLVSRYGSYYINDEVENSNYLTSTVKALTKLQCQSVFKELVASNVWGFGALGQTSPVPARALQKYIDELFKEAQS